MEVKITDYFTKEEIKEILAEAIREQIQKDAERILYNSAYHVIYDAVDEALDGKAKKIITEKAIEIIKNLSEFVVFRKSDVWHKEDSVAYQVLQEAMINNKQKIYDKVLELISNRNYENDLKYAGDYFGETMIEIFKKGLEK